MTVLQVCAYAAEYGGNFMASLLALDNHLSSNGIKTIYLFPITAQNKTWCKELSKTKTVYFADTNRFSLKTYKQIKFAMSQANIIHSHFELYDCLTALALKKHQKLFWHLHDSFDENIDFLHKTINKIQYHFLSKQAVLLSPNTFYAEYVANLGFNKDNIKIIPNCIDTNRIVLNNHMQSSNEKVDFLTFGGFYKIKGLDILLDSCRILKQQGHEFKLGVVGYKQTWEYIDRNYPDISDFITKWVPRENVDYFYNNSKIYISASRREAFPYTLLEALYLKKPSIISDIVGTSWAKRWDCVKFFKSENSNELADLMVKSLTKSDFFSQRLLEQVSRDIKKDFSIDNWVLQIEKEYNNA